MARTFTRNPAFYEKRDEFERRDRFASRAEARTVKARAADFEAMGFDNAEALASRPMKGAKARRYAARMLSA